MTAQARDILFYNDERFFIATEPLEGYLKTISLPHNLVAPTTACWRGYYSKWAIDNNKLFLIEWEGYILDYQKVGIEYLFPDEEFVFANWYSGEIRIPVGEMISYFHGGYLSKYEGDRFLEFKVGELVNEYTKWLSQEEIDRIKKRNDELPF